jgi:hypothetical protein
MLQWKARFTILLVASVTLAALVGKGGKGPWLGWFW